MDGGSGGLGGGQQHYRTATAEPVTTSFQGSDYGLNSGGNSGGGGGGGGGHFNNNSQARGRMRGLSRPPRVFNR